MKRKSLEQLWIDDDDWFTRPEAAMTIDLMVSVADYSNPEDLLTVRRQIAELLVESGRGTQ